METTGVRIAPRWLRTLLIQQRFRCGRPKHTHDHLRDPVAVAACAAYLGALDQRHTATGREVFLVLDHASCHTSAASERDVRGHLAGDSDIRGRDRRWIGAIRRRRATDY
ncbi:MAG: hypothetical protein ACYDAR_02870 [Thermomicrobiales bacterium]